MGRFDPKDSKPGYRVNSKAGNGKHGWGNGPQPKSRIPRSHGDARKGSGSASLGVQVIAWALVGIQALTVISIGTYIYLAYHYGVI